MTESPLIPDRNPVDPNAEPADANAEHLTLESDKVVHPDGYTGADVEANRAS